MISKLAENWGTLLLIAALATTAGGIILVFALREFLNWYLKTNQILVEIDQLRLAVKTLQSRVETKMDSSLATSQTTQTRESIPRVSPVSPSRAFPLADKKISRVNDENRPQNTFALSKESIE